ncbi:hypothetical protein ACTFIW_006526 [Dictyostelium discoideum]
MVQISKKKIITNNNNNNKNNKNNKNNNKNNKNEPKSKVITIQEDKSDKGVLNKVDNFMNGVYDTPEVFVGSTDKIKNSMTDIMSNLYELAKKNESTITETDALDSLVTKGFDGEQIWAQLQLYNDPILQELESKVNDLTTNSNDLNIIKQKKQQQIDHDDDEEDDEEDDENEDDFDDFEDDDEDDDFNLEHDDYQESDLEDELSPQEDSLGDSDIESEELEEEEEEKQEKKSNKKVTTTTTANVNDKDDKKKIKGKNFFGDLDENVDFFDAKEMEKFLDDEDDNEYQRREDQENDEDDDDVELGDSDEDDGGLDLPEAEMDDEEKHLDSLLDKYMEENAEELELERLASKSKSKSKSSTTKKPKSIDPSNMKFNDFFSDPNERGDDEDDDNEFPIDYEDEEGDDDYEDEDDEDDDDDENLDKEEDEEDEEENKEEIKEDKEEATLPPEELSTFQKRAQKIQQRIKELETQNLKKKDWTLVGESSARDRPSDSLLGEVLDYDHTQRATPTITEETNKTIDDMIKKRILEKNFDDVIRKTEKEFKDNYKKKVELSDEKNTEGLGDVYEKSYMKQVLGVEETDELKQKHIKIYELFNKLCYKLDSLSNFQFTPKRIKDRELNITTANALTIEEKIPIATSSATMIAPEEVYFKKNADEKGESELTKEERVKNRKKVKQQWRDEKDEKEAEIRHKKKVDPSFAKKTTVAADMAHLKQASNVTIFDSKKSDVHSGDFRSGKTFATIQQKEENKRKGIDDPNSLKSKKKAKLDSIKGSDFKL